MLLKSKFSIPPHRPELVSRPELMRELENSVNLGVGYSLVCAKAGSGKTTLVSEFLHRRGPDAVWLSLDVNDNDPARFLEYLIEAMNPLLSGDETASLRRLEFQPPPDVENVLALLFAGMADRSTPAVLVFDDYHLIEHDWIHQFMACLTESHPPAVYPIIMSRIDPPFPLARLRGRGRLHEIRDLDLRFSLDEVRKYFNGILDLSLSPRDLSTLTDRTEGWIVGLQMAGISMRSRHTGSELSEFIEHFGGTNRYILDYLMDEVLDQQSREVRDFLIDTSILDRMCPALCDALRIVTAKSRDGSNSHQPPDDVRAAGRSHLILQSLLEKNLFIIPLDDERQWYRYHHLFSELLRTALMQARPEEKVRELHSRASLWYKEAGNLEEAMMHAMEAQEYERAARMIDENIVGILSRSEGPVLLRWIQQLPKNIAQERPWVDIYHAYTLALSGKPMEAGSFLDSAERRIESNMPRASELAGHIAAIRSYIAHLQGEVERVIELAALAEECLPQDHLIARGMSNYALAVTHFANDNMAQAEAASERMLAIGKKLDRLLMVITALCDLASVRKVQGSLLAAQVYYETAHEWLVEKNGLDSRLRCPYEVGLAELTYLWNRLDEAEAHARTGIEYSQRFHVPSEHVAGLLALQDVQLARSDTRAAFRTLQHAEAVSKEHYVRLIVKQELSRARANYSLRVGDRKRARRWVDDEAGASEIEQITAGHVLLVLGESTLALKRFQDLEAVAFSGGRTGRLIEVLALKALALHSLGEPAKARESLMRSLAYAAPENHRRFFFDTGRPMMKLIRDLEGYLREGSTIEVGIPESFPEYLELLIQDYDAELSARPTRAGPAGVDGFDQVIVENLTEREAEVLRLLAQGLSNNDMANRLVVAPSTIKQHLKNIYRKLGVHSRTQAVSRGRDIRLI